MTKTQEIIIDFIRENYGEKDYILKDNDKVIFYENEKRQVLSMNVFCDILNEKNQIIAESDLPHDLLKVGNKVPEQWTLK